MSERGSYITQFIGCEGCALTFERTLRGFETGRLTVAQQVDPEPLPSDWEVEILGAAAAFDLDDTQPETLWVSASTPLFGEPSPDSAQITLIDALTELSVMERQGDWSKVLYAERLGWVNPELSYADPTLVLPMFRPARQPRRETTLRFDEIEVGTELPPCPVPITPTQIIAGAIASRDFEDVHHDRDQAKKKGSPDIFMNILTSNGLCSRR